MHPSHAGLAVVATCCALVGCGGALQPDDGANRDGGGATTLAAPLPGVVPTTPYGAWALVSLDGDPGGNGSTQTSGQLTLTLREDGTAIAHRCTRPYYDSTLAEFRCSDDDAYDCLYGTVVKRGDTWRVDVPDLRAPANDARGEIVAQDDGTLVVRYILPKYAAGHFARTSDVSASVCLVP